MPLPFATLEKILREAFPHSEIHLQDLVGDQDHYKATIISDQFAGKSRLQQHQLVYAALGDLMGTTLHALTLDTKAPKRGESHD